MLQPDTMLGPYRLLDKLGEGGMGVVWRALDTRLDREVALKVLPPDTADDPETLARFEREAKAVASMNHPNIVTLHSVEDVDGVRFITMEKVSGTTLDGLILEDGLPLARFFEVAVPLTDALTAAHERGVIHRDLKPANVMITTDGRLKVLDFGLAKLHRPEEPADPSGLPTESATALTRVGRVMGTVPYMSPEQLQGKDLDQRTDIFSLGIMLYEMATGLRPFAGDSSADLITSIMRDVPPPVTDVKHELPHHLGRIVRHCLVKDPERRYQTVKDLRNDLDDLRNELNTGQLAARAMPPAAAAAPAAAPRSRSLRWLLGSAAGVLVVLLLVAAGTLLPRRSPPAPAGPYSVAVLPFANFTGNAGQDYLCAGISSGLITQLGEIAGVRMLGRTAMHGAVAAGESPLEIADGLGASALLEGDVQQTGQRLRVDVKLTDVESATVVWSGPFEGRVDRPFELQKQIARQLAVVLSIPLSPRELERLGRDPTKSYQAYDYYLRGLRQLEDFTDARGVESSAEMLRQAIRLDPRFALAHVGLSTALWSLYRQGGDRAQLDESEREARLALEIDPELPAAQVALARALLGTGRSAESIDTLKAALARHPKPAEAQLALAYAYEQVGDLDAAERCLQAAVAFDAHDWYNWNQLGVLLDRLGRYDEAREAWENSAERAPPQIGVPRTNLAALTMQQGWFKKAIEIYSQLPRPIRGANVASNIGTAYYFSDEPDKWERAEEYYRLAVRLNPRSAAIRRNLADLLIERDRRDEALAEYGEAMRLVEVRLESDPTDLVLQLERALYAAKADLCDSALPAAAELAGTLPQTASDQHDLAQVWAVCGRTDEAVRTLREAMRLGVPAELIRQEREFAGLRANPDYRELVGDE